MKFLSKMERRFGRYAIRELPVIMIAFQVVGYTLSMLAPNTLNMMVTLLFSILVRSSASLSRDL